MFLYNPVSTLAASLCSLYTDSVRDRPSSPPPPLCRTQARHYEWFKKAWSSDYEYDATVLGCRAGWAAEKLPRILLLLVNTLMKID